MLYCTSKTTSKGLGMSKHKQNSKDITTEVTNSLSSVIASLGGYGLGTAFGSTQVSQVDTLFKNNRWYLVSNIRQVLSELYAEHGIVQTLVDLPVDDAFRGGLEIITDEFEQEDLEELNYKLDREGVLEQYTQAKKWARLFGGGALLIINDEDPKTEFKVEHVKEGDKITFKPVDMWELYYGVTNVEQLDGPDIAKNPDYYNYYGKQIHKSRVLRMEGKQAPSLIRPKLRGWGMSIIEPVVRSYNQYLKSVNLAFEVMDEFKVDIYGIEGFNTALMSPNGSDKVTKRVQMANVLKNYQNALVMDNKDKFESKQISFTGLAETMREIRMQIAADLRMPLTKLFGMSAAGFNSGEDDIENYNSMIETEIRSKSRKDLLKVIEICCAMWFGHVPETMQIDFAPLRVLSAEQEENIKNEKLQRIINCMQAGVMTAVEAKKAINKEMLLPVQINEDDELIPTAQGVEDENISEVDIKTNSKPGLFEKLKQMYK